jgi:hypothetical protein
MFEAASKGFLGISHDELYVRESGVKAFSAGWVDI